MGLWGRGRATNHYLHTEPTKFANSDIAAMLLSPAGAANLTNSLLHSSASLRPNLVCNSKFANCPFTVTSLARQTRLCQYFSPSQGLASDLPLPYQGSSRGALSDVTNMSFCFKKCVCSVLLTFLVLEKIPFSCMLAQTVYP